MTTQHFQPYAWSKAMSQMVPIGRPLETEADAWRAVHNIARQFWPDNAIMRRLFEATCKVSLVTRIEIR